MPCCPAIARRSPRARAAHENTCRLSRRKTIVPRSERLRVTPVVTHPSSCVVRRMHGVPRFSTSRGRRTRTTSVRGPPHRERGNRDRRGSTYPSRSRLSPSLPVAAASPSPPCGDARSPSSTDRSSSRDEPHAKSTHRPCVYAAPKEPRSLPGPALIAARFERTSIIAIRLHRQRARPPTPPIRRAGSPRDRPARPTAQSFKSLPQVARLVDRLGRMIVSLARIGSSATGLRRNLNCWTAAITRKHRPVYERTYPTTLVFSDGSSIEIPYHEPRKIIVLPLNLAELTEAEQKKRLEMRKPKTKLVITEEIEDSFDENRYLNFNK